MPSDVNTRYCVYTSRQSLHSRKCSFNSAHSWGAKAPEFAKAPSSLNFSCSFITVRSLRLTGEGLEQKHFFAVALNRDKSGVEHFPVTRRVFPRSHAVPIRQSK